MKKKNDPLWNNGQVPATHQNQQPVPVAGSNEQPANHRKNQKTGITDR